MTKIFGSLQQRYFGKRVGLIPTPLTDKLE